MWPSFDFEQIRWVGVLPRIACVFLICALIFLYTKRKTQLIIASVILVLYWLVMKYLPVPGIGMPDLSEPGKNWANYLDQNYLPGYLWKKTWDPEGILSSFTAIVTGILGMTAGFVLVSKKTLKDKLLKLFLMAATLLILGDFSQYLMPLNKSIWSSSFTLMLGGISCLLLAFFVYFIYIKDLIICKISTLAVLHPEADDPLACGFGLAVITQSRTLADPFFSPCVPLITHEPWVVRATHGEAGCAPHFASFRALCGNPCAQYGWGTKSIQPSLALLDLRSKNPFHPIVF